MQDNPFEKDKFIDYRLMSRILVAFVMTEVKAVAAYYEKGHYWFLFPKGELLSSHDIAQIYKDYHISGYHILCAIEHIGAAYMLQDVPPGFPIIDPIYFGT